MMRGAARHKGGDAQGIVAMSICSEEEHNTKADGWLFQEETPRQAYV
jgi:hypothetical protein